MDRFFRSPMSQLSQQGCALTAARKYLRFAYQKFAFLVKITARGRIFDDIIKLPAEANRKLRLDTSDNSINL